jgi:16S rRNA (guanine(966)-N(2))-methyltransferase RsmD
MIGPYFDGGQALDLFAGTGGLGIEALSRGMERAVFTDVDKKSIEIIRENVRATGFEEKAEIYRNDAVKALKALAKRKAKFDLVFLDPPYRLKILRELVEMLHEYELLAEGASIVMEHDAEDTFENSIGGCVVIRRARYGETAVTIYKYKGKTEWGDEQS